MTYRHLNGESKEKTGGVAEAAKNYAPPTLSEEQPTVQVEVIS